MLPPIPHSAASARELAPSPNSASGLGNHVICVPRCIQMPRKIGSARSVHDIVEEDVPRPDPSSPSIFSFALTQFSHGIVVHKRHRPALTRLALC